MSGIRIIDPATGKAAEVTDDRQISVFAESRTTQGFISQVKGRSFQVWDTTVPASGAKTLLHMKNGDADRDLIITYIRVQILPNAGTSAPNESTYFQFGFGATVSSGGDTLTPVNSNRRVGTAASGTFTGNGPTMGGTFTEAERWYPQSDGQMMAFNKEGAFILGLNDTFEIRVNHDAASGLAYARVTFMYSDK